MSNWLTKNPLLVMAIVLFAFVIAQFFWPEPKERVKWGEDYTVAMKDAKQNNRLVLAYFTASWCGPCRQMKRTTFADQAVADEVAKFSAVKIDVDQQRELAESAGVQYMPSFFIYTSDGELLTSRGSYMDSQQFIEFLENARAMHDVLQSSTTSPITGPGMMIQPALP